MLFFHKKGATPQAGRVFFATWLLRPANHSESLFSHFFTRGPQGPVFALYFFRNRQSSLSGLLYSRPSTDFRNKALFRAWVLRPVPHAFTRKHFARESSIRISPPVNPSLFTPGHYFSYPAMKDQNVLQKLREFQADCIFQFKFSTERKNARAFCASDK